jgi:hypothetical protein
LNFVVVSISQWRHFGAASIGQEDFKINREQDILLMINRQTWHIAELR